MPGLSQSVERSCFQLFFQSITLSPCLHYDTMSLNHSRAASKAAGKAKAKAKAKVRVRARATAKAKQRVRTAAKNQRRGERRRCVQKLNELAVEVGAPRIHLDRRTASGPELDPWRQCKYSAWSPPGGDVARNCRVLDTRPAGSDSAP